MRQRIFDLVRPAAEGDYGSRAYDIFIVIVAIVSLVPMLFDTSKISQLRADVLWVVDVITAYLLLFDYFLRWMTHDFKTGKGWKAFIIYPFTPMALIDILAILPTLNVVPQTLRFLRILRVVKVFRYSRNLLVVTNACRREARTLASVFAAVVVYMLTVALIVFTAEPESFTNFFDAVCWSATVMTSISFSDARPVGYLGQVLSIVSSLVALLVIALPAGIITAAYINEVRESKKTGSRYFAMSGRTKIRLRELEDPRAWLHNNSKVVRYALVMFVCVVGNVALSTFLVSIGSPIWLSSIASALTAFLLEPAAGIIVAFIGAVVVTLVQSDVTSMLYCFSYSIVALGFGFLFPRPGSKHKVLRLLALLAILVFVIGLVDAGICLLRNDGDIEAALAWVVDSNYAGVLLVSNLGLPTFQTYFLGFFADRFIETIPLAILFFFVVKVFGVHAAPSERELRQQQEILLERALAQKKVEDEELRRIARKTIERKYRDVLDEQEKLARERAMLEQRLAELDAERPTRR